MKKRKVEFFSLPFSSLYFLCPILYRNSTRCVLCRYVGERWIFRAANSQRYNWIFLRESPYIFIHPYIRHTSSIYRHSKYIIVVPWKFCWCCEAGDTRGCLETYSVQLYSSPHHFIHTYTISLLQSLFIYLSVLQCIPSAFNVNGFSRGCYKVASTNINHHDSSPQVMAFSHYMQWEPHGYCCPSHGILYYALFIYTIYTVTSHTTRFILVDIASCI